MVWEKSSLRKICRPDDWYFPCHFRDDEVLAGSLQAEGGGNLLRFFMMMLGLQRLTKDARFQPIFDLASKGKMSQASRASQRHQTDLQISDQRNRFDT